MKIKRIWDTLTYFDVIPSFPCLSKFFPAPSTPNQLTMNNILVCSNQTPLAEDTIKFLQEKNYPVTVITPQTPLNSGIFTRVTQIICFSESFNPEIINLLNKYLQPQETYLFNFAHPDSSIKESWGAVDDVVMGGVSESRLLMASNEVIFTGNVSTANNGGFASIRTKNFTPPLDLSAYETILLRVKGDGNRYKFITRCEGKWDGISYCYSFDTVKDTWQTVEIKCADLIPVFRAKTVPEAGNFDRSKVYSLQLMLSKFEYDGGYNPSFQAGNFNLALEWIKGGGAHGLPKVIIIGNNSFSLSTPHHCHYVENYADL
ncbi:MAG: CIA30 family protein [Cyanobacterium sp. T60_A2020_053]|nr:CIA30 family protein [Cyanobacterium sp. T60_A2020_053]